MRAISVFNVIVTIVGAMGLMGMGLSIVGLYGQVACAATRRTLAVTVLATYIPARRASRINPMQALRYE